MGEEMNFVLGKTIPSVGRVGSVTFGSKTVSTPTMMVTTKRLCVPHLTADNFARSIKKDEFCALQVMIEPLLEEDCVIARQSPFGLSKLMGFGEDTPIILSTDDAEYYQGVKSDRDTPLTLNNNENEVSLINSNGVTLFNIKKHLPLITGNMKAAALIAPTDHYNSATARLKRLRRSNDLSAKYFKQASEIFGNTIPSASLHRRNAETSEKEEFVRIEINKRGEQLGGAPSKLYSLILEDPLCLPASLPSDSAVIVRGSWLDAKFIVECFKKGADIFDSSFATKAATEGIALNIRPDGTFDSLKMNEEQYFEDFSPLSELCDCIACDGDDKTTRSYIHHLVMNSEMLGSVYLSSHNLRQLARLLKSLGQSVDRESQAS